MDKEESFIDQFNTTMLGSVKLIDSRLADALATRQVVDSSINSDTILGKLAIAYNKEQSKADPSLAVPAQVNGDGMIDYKTYLSTNMELAQKFETAELFTLMCQVGIRRDRFAIQSFIKDVDKYWQRDRLIKFIKGENAAAIIDGIKVMATVFSKIKVIRDMEDDYL